MMTYTPPTLIAGTLAPWPVEETSAPVWTAVHRAIPAPLPAAGVAASAAPVFDRYAIQERTIDCVVDRLLKELTW